MLDGARLRIQAAAAAIRDVPNKTLSGLLGKQISRPKDSWVNKMFGDTYNPDRQIPDYKRMVDYDAQIKAGLDLITYTLLSKKVVITPAADDPEEPIEMEEAINLLTGPEEPSIPEEPSLNEEIADFLEDMLGNMKTTMRRVRKDIYTAIPYGFSVSEIIYRYDEQSNQIVWDDVKSIDIDTLDHCFVYDEFGDLKEIKQDYGGVTGDNTIPPEKCLIYSFDEEFGNKYGRSILKQVYDHWFMKRKTLKWFNIFLEKLQSPLLYGKVVNPTDQEKLLDTLDDVKEGKANVVVNKDDELGILETALKGEGFQSAIAYHDTMIFRRFMIGSLILGQTDASGSYAQSQTHREVFTVVLDGIHEDVAAIFQRKLKELVDMNYDVDKYPTFSFEPVTEKDIIGLLTALQPLFVNGKIDTRQGWFEDLIKEAVERFASVNVEFKDLPGQATPPAPVVPAAPAPNTEPTTAKTPIAEPTLVEARSHSDSHVVAGVKEYLREQGVLRGL